MFINYTWNNNSYISHIVRIMGNVPRIYVLNLFHCLRNDRIILVSWLDILGYFFFSMHCTPVHWCTLLMNSHLKPFMFSPPVTLSASLHLRWRGPSFRLKKRGWGEKGASLHIQCSMKNGFLPFTCKSSIT